jgi:signal transduction histidine kinase/CheY-like chemotaxis protein
MDNKNHNLNESFVHYSVIEEALQTSYSVMPVLMGTVELLPEGDLLHLYDNPATNRFFGSAPGSTVGRTARSLGVPDATIALWRARYEEAVAHSIPVSFEYAHEAGAGASPRILAVKVAPLSALGPHGTPTCCYIAEDVTERRRSESLLRRVIDSTSDGVFVLSPDWRIELMNGIATNSMNAERDVTGQNFWEVYPAIVGGAFWRAYHLCMTERVPTEADEYYEPLARSFAVRAFPLEGGGITVFFQDITERRAAEQALLEADRRRNEFLAMLGHELRNPLAPIANAVQLLELLGEQVEQRNAAVQIIRRQTTHIARLVDDLLEVSRVTQGHIELRKENILIASAVFSAIETVRPLVREREQMLHVDVAQDIDLVVDQARLIQILANLLNNASKYTQPGGRIEVRGRAIGDNDGCVEIVVSDNGPGIDADLLPRIFDVFSQGATTLDRSRGGLGLGLALVKRLVELHGGKVLVESAGPGKGTAFTIRLPRVERRKIPRDIVSKAPRRAVAPTTFLVVDDNPDALDTLAMLLDADGHRVERAHDGEEALAVARRFVPNVILLDVGLPKLDGWEVARRLRSDPITARAVMIALSGYGQADDRERSRDSGFDDHLLKPATLDAIYKAVAANIAPPRL